MTENACTFTPDSMTINGNTFPAGYSVTPDGNVFVFVPVTMDGQERKVRIKITTDDARHAAALAAAKGYTAEVTQPDNGVIVAETRIDITQQPGQAEPEQAETQPEQTQEQPAEAQPEQPQEEQPARDPKQTRGPVPDKLFVGMEIKGKGWKIVFDGSYDRTRVIFKRKPSNAAREAVQAAGFYWSPAMESWNKKLTHKAFRAAQELAVQLRTICG